MKKLIAFLLPILLFTACSSDPKDSKTELTLVHATDMHYLSPQLSDNSEIFIEYIKSGDGKVTHYSEEVCNAFVADMVNMKPDAVLITGDISFNCEKLSHEDFTAKLREIEKAGIDVLTIPGNHDLEYPFSRKYEGDSSTKADYTTKEDFAAMYADFGPDIAYTKSPDGLSYIAKLGKDIYVAAIYTPHSFMSGIPAADEDMLAWLDTELGKLGKDAKVITLTHQNVLHHYPNEDFNRSYTIYNADKLVEIYDKNGVDLNLSGHIHLQHIGASDSGVTDIATASMTVADCHYGVVQITPEKMLYNVQRVDVNGWAANNGATDENLLNFRQYAKQFYYESAYEKAMGRIADMNIPEEEKAALASTWANFNLHYFSGDVNEWYKDIMNSDGYKLGSSKYADNFLYTYLLNAMNEDLTENSHINWEKEF